MSTKKSFECVSKSSGLKTMVLEASGEAQKATSVPDSAEE